MTPQEKFDRAVEAFAGPEPTLSPLAHCAWKGKKRGANHFGPAYVAMFDALKRMDKLPACEIKYDPPVAEGESIYCIQDAAREALALAEKAMELAEPKSGSSEMEVEG